MNADIYDDIAIENLAKDYFGTDVTIGHVVSRDLPTGHTTRATVFITTQKQLFVLVTGRAPLTCGDVGKILKRMGVVPADFLPPKHDPNYFANQAAQKFRQVFPGLRPVSEDDLRYYKKLVHYNPALVRVKSIPSGIIKQFDPSDTTGWRPAVKLAYGG